MVRSCCFSFSIFLVCYISSVIFVLTLCIDSVLGPVNYLGLLPRSLLQTPQSFLAANSATIPMLRRYVQPFPLFQEVLPLDRIHVQPVLLVPQPRHSLRNDTEFENLLNIWSSERGNKSEIDESAELKKLRETNAALLTANNEMHQMLLNFAAK